MVNAMQRGAYTQEKARTTSTNHHGADPDPAAPPPQGPAPPRVGTPGLLRTNGFSTFCLLSISSGEKWFSHLRFICTLILIRPFWIPHIGLGPKRRSCRCAQENAGHRLKICPHSHVSRTPSITADQSPPMHCVPHRSQSCSNLACSPATGKLCVGAKAS
jgi:hypothetical protein